MLCRQKSLPLLLAKKSALCEGLGSKDLEEMEEEREGQRRGKGFVFNLLSITLHNSYIIPLSRTMTGCEIPIELTRTQKKPLIPASSCLNCHILTSPRATYLVLHWVVHLSNTVWMHVAGRKHAQHEHVVNMLHPTTLSTWLQQLQHDSV